MFSDPRPLLSITFRVLMPLWRTAGTDAIVKDSLIMWPEGQWEASKKLHEKGTEYTWTLRIYERIGLRANSLKIQYKCLITTFPISDPLKKFPPYWDIKYIVKFSKKYYVCFCILTSGDNMECSRISGALLLQGIFLESSKHKAGAINSQNTIGNALHTGDKASLNRCGY